MKYVFHCQCTENYNYTIVCTFLQSLTIAGSIQDLETEGSRQVNFDEILEYCKRCNCPLLETSAKTGLNVTESFRLLLDRISELRPTKFKDSILSLPMETNDDSKKCTIS